MEIELDGSLIPGLGQPLQDNFLASSQFGDALQAGMIDIEEGLVNGFKRRDPKFARLTLLASEAGFKESDLVVPYIRGGWELTPDADVFPYHFTAGALGELALPKNSRPEDQQKVLGKASATLQQFESGLKYVINETKRGVQQVKINTARQLLGGL